jgi:hypothetical protein
MGREPVTQEIAGLKVTSSPLPFPRSQELLPEVGQLMALVMRELGSVNVKLTDDIMTLAPALGSLTAHLSGGTLERLAPKLLASTQVIMEDARGEKAVFDLLKEKDRNAVFDEHPEAYFPILIFAGRVTFARFFPASVLTGGPQPTA